MGDGPWHAKCKLFGGKKTPPEAVLQFAVVCAPVARIIRMVSSLAPLRKWAWLTWSLVLYIFLHFCIHSCSPGLIKRAGVVLHELI